MPNTLMFADFGFDDRRRAAQWDRLGTWFDTVPDGARVVVLDIGTGLTVPVLRAKAETLALSQGWPVVRINPEPTPWPGDLTGVQVQALAGAALGALAARVSLG